MLQNKKYSRRSSTKRNNSIQDDSSLIFEWNAISENYEHGEHGKEMKIEVLCAKK